MRPEPWVLVCGGFHDEGGMDRANAELARYLSDTGHPVHLVSHRVAVELAARTGVRVHLARKTAGSFFLAEGRLDRLGRAVAADVTARTPSARVLVNGVNCDWPDINWVHYVHRAAPRIRPGAPLWFRLKHGMQDRLNTRREDRLLSRASIVLANSERTRRDLIERAGVAPERVRTVYLGCAVGEPVTPARRVAARAWLECPPERPLVVFVGALGHDGRKGFDTLWAAWRALCQQPSWDAMLVVAGGGRGLAAQRAAVTREGPDARVRMIGFTSRIEELLAAADLLVSPVRYESYGLNVHEALCCGVPAIVSAAAGVAERYPTELRDLLLPDPNDARDLAMRMLHWRANLAEARRRVAPLAAVLRAWSWRDMAERIVAEVRSTDSAAVAAAAESGIRCDRIDHVDCGIDQGAG
jgi:glycosyltransferase involved in cell wall biosynthesis